MSWAARVAGHVRRIQGLEEKTANFDVTVADDGKWFSNEGASGTITATFNDTFTQGLSFGFVRTATQAFRIEPGASAKFIYSGGTPADGKYLELGSDGAKVKVIVDSNLDLVCLEEHGTLNEEA